MKVLHVIPSVAPLDGGPSAAIADIERSLCERGIDVVTATTVDRGADDQLNTAVITPHATRWYFRRGTEQYKVSLGLLRYLSHNIKSFDVVHAHALFSFAPTVACLLAKQLGVPYILRPLGVLGSYGMTRRHPILKRISVAVLETRLLSAAHAVHFTSIAEEAAARTLNLSFVSSVIPLSVDTNKYKPFLRSARQHGEFNILFLSRIDPKKNIEALLQAASRWIQASPRRRVTIAGSGDPEYIRALKTLAIDLKISKSVSWLGHVEDSAKIAAFAAADAFILPSHDENFGIAVAEALASGLPCIVSNKVGIGGEIARAGAGLITGTDSDSIANALQRVVTEPARQSMANAARELAEEAFSLQVMGSRLESLYCHVVENRAERVRIA